MPLTFDEPYSELTREIRRQRHLAKVCSRAEEAYAKGPNRKPRELPDGVSHHKLNESGWGVIFSTREIQRGAEEGLRPLLELREQQAGGGYLEGGRYLKKVVERAQNPWDFLYQELHTSPGTIQPSKMPYYVLLIASPVDISFDVQFALSINHAVGRVYFTDPTHYAFYARAVTTAEENRPNRPSRVELFAVKDQEDSALVQLDQFLVRPLLDKLQNLAPAWGWQGERLPETTRTCLLERFKGRETPGILLASCHGLSYEPSLPRQPEWQGAVECSDGHVWAQDLNPLNPKDAALHGLVVWMFSCFGAGTSLFESYPKDYLKSLDSPSRPQPEPVADRAFVSKLPETLLANGALAVLGHVNRGWTLSFRWLYQHHVIESAHSMVDSLMRFLRGARLGHALRPLARRHSAVTAQLSSMIEALDAELKIDEGTLRLHRVAAVDARGFIVLGDPAVYALGQPLDERPIAALSDATDFADSVFLDPNLTNLIRQQADKEGINNHDWIQKALKEALRNKKRHSETATGLGTDRRYRKSDSSS